MKKSSIINRKHFFNRRYLSRYRFLIDNYKKGAILDVGNIGGIHGEGKKISIHHKFKEYAKDSKVFGIDLYKPMKLESFTKQVVGNLEVSLPYKSNCFDTVYLGELIEHLSNFRSVFTEINRVLKKDGKLILDTPNPYSLMNISKWIIKREENLQHPDHSLFFTPASIKATLEMHNFSIEILSEKIPRQLRFIPYYFIKGMGAKLLISAKKLA